MTMEKSTFKKLMKEKIKVMLVLAEKAVEREDYTELDHLAGVIKEKVNTLLNIDK